MTSRRRGLRSLELRTEPLPVRHLEDTDQLKAARRCCSHNRRFALADIAGLDPRYVALDHEMVRDEHPVHASCRFRREQLELLGRWIELTQDRRFLDFTERVFRRLASPEHRTGQDFAD